ncbi:MAG: hypothetical protein J0I48_12895 [Devosia sp.]|uniref:hypothetical protein n=1 Tax=Devosia sp. 66-22 TaxID=1895753 RepID=UPI000927622E|nr:hypothetical protein [Devosia sp. 66-22]MBN9347077.1 hypothetical protein [Devosia sp.]OJX50292.1 MAG: hypothetical protein BGO81_04210 [Devosia sp. 66-22]
MNEHEAPLIEAKPDEYRQVFTRPLDNPRVLLASLAFFAVAAVGSAAVAAWQGGFWWALVPIPSAMLAGVAIAGLMPSQFFGRRDN